MKRFIFFALVISLQLSADCCPETCKACSSLSDNDCKIKKKCITVPARETEQGFIPEAEIYVRLQGKNDGKKPVILFVHGNGFTSDSFKCQQEEFCDCYYTIALDMRGFGRSSKTSPNSIDYTYEVWADDIKSVLTQLGVDTFVWVGNSIGGNIGMLYSLRYPGEITSLALLAADPLVTVLDPSCTSPDCELLPSCDWQFPAETLCSLQFFGQVIADIGFEAFVRQFLVPAFFNEPCQEELSEVQEYAVESFLEEGQDILINISTHAQAQDLRPLLPQISVPTLVAYGSIDVIVPPGASLYIHDQLPNSVLAEFAGKGHQLQITGYKQFNRLLKKFLSSCDMPEFTRVFDEGCCICPKVKPVPFEQCEE